MQVFKKFVCYLSLGVLLACGTSNKQESSQVQSERERSSASCETKKAICEAEARRLMPNSPEDRDYHRKLDASIQKSIECSSKYMCESF